MHQQHLRLVELRELAEEVHALPGLFWWLWGPLQILGERGSQKPGGFHSTHRFLLKAMVIPTVLSVLTSRLLWLHHRATSVCTLTAVLDESKCCHVICKLYCVQGEEQRREDTPLGGIDKPAVKPTEVVSQLMLSTLWWDGHVLERSLHWRSWKPIFLLFRQKPNFGAVFFRTCSPPVWSYLG